VSKRKSMDMTKNSEVPETTLALLKILALGDCEIEQGKFKDAEAIFAKIDQLDLPRNWRTGICRTRPGCP